jgi:TolB-like protein
MSFWAELKRRNVVKVGAAYAVLGWLILQVANNLFPPLGLPPWTQTLVAALLLLGFPFALLLAWIYEITPEGIKRTSEVPEEQSVRHLTSHRLNYVLTGLLVVAVAAIALDTYVWRRPRDVASLPSTADAVVPPAAPSATGATGTGAQPGYGRLPNSVAVLPFDNLSTDPERAYFAAGIHEEILNHLAKIRSLSITSRTSVLRYTRDRPSIPEIARALNVEAVMEGSVRYAGDRIQVSVQLIDATTDAHMWSETYPGDLSDLDAIFALQADIAMNVANALRAELTPTELASIEQPPTSSPEAYAYYLAALDAQRGDGSVETLTRALELVDSALALDADFASAWAVKSGTHNSLAIQGPLVRLAEELEAAEQAAQRAIEIAPESGEAHSSLAFALTQRGKLVESETEYRKAKQLGLADGADAGYSVLSLAVGNFARAREIAVAGRDLDPMNETTRAFLISAHAFDGDIAAAVAEHARGREFYGDWALGDEHIMRVRIGSGDKAALAELMLDDPVATVARENLDSPREASVALRRLHDDPTNANPPALQRIALWAAYFDDQELALDVMEEVVSANKLRAYVFWYPQMRDVRRSLAFKEIMRNAGFVDYWNEFGWPETCRPTAGDDFECV